MKTIPGEEKKGPRNNISLLFLQKKKKVSVAFGRENEKRNRLGVYCLSGHANREGEGKKGGSPDLN